MYKLINPQSIFQYFGEDDKEMIIEMINIIIDTNLHDLKQLDIFYENKDFDFVKKKCHKAKPSMSYIGALGTRKILENIESDLENSRELYQNLKENITIIEEELSHFIENL